MEPGLGDSFFSMWYGWRSLGDIQLMTGLVIKAQNDSTYIYSTLLGMDERRGSVGNLEWILLTWRTLITQTLWQLMALRAIVLF